MLSGGLIESVTMAVAAHGVVGVIIVVGLWVVGGVVG